MTEIDWRTMVNKVWDRKTVPEACEEMGLDFGEVYKEMRDAEFRRLFVDVSIVASVRDEMLEEISNASTADDS